jgi:hypothetical protein
MQDQGPVAQNTSDVASFEQLQRRFLARYENESPGPVPAATQGSATVPGNPMSPDENSDV